MRNVFTRIRPGILLLLCVLCLSLTAQMPSAQAKTKKKTNKKTTATATTVAKIPAHNGKDMNKLKSQLKSMTKGYRGSWSVYVKDLKSGGTINVNDKTMYPASTIKAFVMAATFDKINRKKFSYGSVSGLLHSMITVSDNEAYNQLVKRNGSGNFVKGASSINKWLKQNGFKKTRVHSTLHPASSGRITDGHRNVSSAKECGLLLEKIYTGKCVNKKYSEMMLSLLKHQTRRWKIPSGVPSGVKTANKTGETSSVQHDMAIVYGKKTNYIICVFSTTSEGNGVNGIRRISSTVYHFLN